MGRFPIRSSKTTTNTSKVITYPWCTAIDACFQAENCEDFACLGATRYCQVRMVTTAAEDDTYLCWPSSEKL